MEKPWFTPPRLLWLVFSSKRVVKVSAWCITHVRHTRVNTSMGFESIIFWFSKYKNLYVVCFQIYMYYKKILVVSDLILIRWGSENVFWSPKSFKRDLNHRRIYMFHYKWVLYLWIVLSFIYWFMIKLLVYSLMVKLFYIYYLFISHRAYLAHTRFLLIPFRFVPALVPVRGG